MFFTHCGKGLQHNHNDHMKDVLKSNIFLWIGYAFPSLVTHQQHNGDIKVVALPPTKPS